MLQRCPTRNVNKILLDLAHNEGISVIRHSHRLINAYTTAMRKTVTSEVISQSTRGFNRKKISMTRISPKAANRKANENMLIYQCVINFS